MLEELGVSVGDLVKYEADRNFCRVVGTYTNSSGSDRVISTGLPVVVTDATGAVALGTQATDGDVNGLLLIPDGRRKTIANGEAVKVVVLRRGPAVVNRDCIVLEDPAGGGDMAIADVLAALADEDIRTIEEPAIEETHET